MRIALITCLLCAGIAFADDSEWYTFKSTGSKGESVIGLEDWLQLDGRVSMKDDKLLAGGRPIRLWGANTNFGANAPEKQIADQRADFFAKYGLNLARLHKLTGAGWAGFGDPASALKFDKDGIDRFDYYTNALRTRGIRYSFSAVFKFRVGPEDRDRIPFFDEAFKVKRRGGVKGDAYGLVQASPELQELVIEQMVKLLKHRNPYSKLTYADDPALVYIEMLNEENLYFYSSMGAILKVPTLKKQFARQFSDWLKKKYGSHAKLVDAWGKGALDGFGKKSFPNEHLNKGNIYPVGNPWFFAPEQLNGSQSRFKQRLIDTMVFFHDVQVAFFEKYKTAMRQAGFKGFFVGSNWQAGSGVGHLLNLHSDAHIGMIDRHNYFGGGKKKRGPFNHKSLLAKPGMGFFGSGLQQVADRPFMLSEWIHVMPNEWAGEGPIVVAAYGLGLQGWDAATIFTQRKGGTNSIAPTMFESPWDFGKPNIITLYPAISRMILRGDVSEAKTIGKLRVNVNDLRQGKLGFDAKVIQDADVKEFSTDAVPPVALAVGRCAIEFVENSTPTQAVNPEKYRKNGAYVSTTGQLKWYPGETETSGYITIDTKATKAAVGFLPASPINVGGITITPTKAGFACIMITALEPDEDLENGGRVLVCAVARARQTGMKLNAAGNVIQNRGRPPILMEPVQARIQLKRSLQGAILLDHDGRLTKQKAKASSRDLDVNTGRDKSMYYLLNF